MRNNLLPLSVRKHLTSSSLLSSLLSFIVSVIKLKNFNKQLLLRVPVSLPHIQHVSKDRRTIEGKQWAYSLEGLHNNRIILDKISINFIANAWVSKPFL